MEDHGKVMESHGILKTSKSMNPVKIESTFLHNSTQHYKNSEINTAQCQLTQCHIPTV